MARTYSHTPVLSKVKIGNDTYYLKDGDARAILDAINADVYAALQLDLGTVAGNDGKLVTAANIKTYVDTAVSGVHAFTYEVVNALPANPTADNMYIIYLVAKESPNTGYLEYLCIETDHGEGADPRYTYAFEEIGDTDVDLSGYVTSVDYSNGALTYTTANGTENVHTFGDLADADTASTSYTPAGTIDTITVIDSVGTQASFSQGEDTFAQGEDTFTQGTDSFTANTPTALDLTKFDGGSKAADSFSAGTVTTIDTTKFDGGSLGAATKSAFATEGIVASVGTGDDAECLIFGAASTSNAVTDQGSFTPASLASGFYSEGTAPSFTEGQFTPASLANGFYTPGSAASFTQGTDSFTQGTDTFTQGNDSFTANYVATTKSVTPAFTGTAATITVEPDSGE